MTQPNVVTGVPIASPTPQKSWIARHWPWLIPVGCLGVLAILAGGIVICLSLVFGIFKSTDVYKEAMAKVAADPRVVEALGSPIKAGFFITGKIEVRDSSGTADLSIPISGPKGGATLHVLANKSGGTWTFERLIVDVKRTGEPIDLLSKDVI